MPVTGSYVAQVAKALDVEPDEPLNLANTHTMLALAKAISRNLPSLTFVSRLGMSRHAV